MDHQATVYFTFTISVLLLMKSGYCHDVISDTCSYTFQIWRPDENIEHKVKYLELEFANMSSFLDKTLMQFRNEMNMCTRNRTYRGGRRSGSKVKERASNAGLSDFQRELNEMVNRLNHLTSDYINLKNELVPSPGQEKAEGRRKPMGLVKNGQSDLVPSTVLENNVNDLKAEWILMKRDLLHLNSENSHIKHAQNRIQREATSLNRSLVSLGSKLQILEMEVTSGLPIHRSLPSQSDARAVGTSSFKDAQRRLENDVARLDDELQDLRTSLKKLNDHINVLRNDNVHLKRMVIAASKGKTLNDPKIDLSELMDRTMGEIPTDCHDLYNLGYDVSGVYQIKPRNAKYQDDMYCQFVNNTAYTVIQRRTDGLIHFNRRWIEYKYGFGNLYDEHWIGNEVIHLLSQQRNYILRIDMWDWEGKQAYAEYEGFLVDGQERGYTLHIGDYQGNAGDSLSYHNGIKFSTEDVDNDLNMRNCAAENKAGWWFNTCYLSNLNGVYRTGWYSHSQSTFSDGIVWYTLKESEEYSLKKVEMKLRRAG